MTVSESIIRAQEKASQPWVETPLRESYVLSQAAGCRVFLKLETVQPSGSFKSRGIGYYLLRRLEELPVGSQPHIFCSSGGNAGLAAVHAARALGLPCTVVVPQTIKPLMVTKIKAAGAFEVIQHGNAWADADEYMRTEIMTKTTKPTIYAPPFDHPDIWTGNSTIMHEIAAQMPSGTAPDAIICSVGGGGLFNGIHQAMDSLAMHSTTVVAVETEGAHSLKTSMNAGQVVTMPKITSLATSLGCARVTQSTFDYAQRANVRTLVLPDAEAAMGCWRLADDERIMVELACGVNVALLYDGRLEQALGRPVRKEDKVVVVLCGGSNVTIDMLGQWREEYAWLDNVGGKDAVQERHDSAVGSPRCLPSDITAPN
ncbi:tryptophan synthase beta subunit-like PLP-dependent enzyme [Aaosphaeria arxii CBS 175.79]|uniref:L-serine ammonia-lyase n=1 Tax=Aaosphaeria arxii CBS 175.79 TaxID=1450172 RepID=A0A6A5XSW3_9PLEO|nr:tryptophan synthase beta subunit-like PLP-dependent enzyme [Aaosphaeria arxii CBS 175.79]KAF2015841.1 tryptophan synthase beta subunit-like PLP-dependent enzyme [Aaosphaeria arxii CBS 175.79]